MNSKCGPIPLCQENFYFTVHIVVHSPHYAKYLFKALNANIDHAWNTNMALFGPCLSMLGLKCALEATLLRLPNDITYFAILNSGCVL